MPKGLNITTWTVVVLYDSTLTVEVDYKQLIEDINDINYVLSDSNSNDESILNINNYSNYNSSDNKEYFNYNDNDEILRLHDKESNNSNLDSNDDFYNSNNKAFFDRIGNNDIEEGTENTNIHNN